MVAFFVSVAVVGMVIYLFTARSKRGSAGMRIGIMTSPMWIGIENAGSYKDLDNKLISFYHQLLTKYIDYYRKLGKADRKKFIDRLHELIEHMEFQGRDGQAINLKVSALCCAPVIQITMGLDTWLFNQYHTIVVYPRQFYSEAQRTYVKGGVSRGDAIFLSYEDLLKGYAHPSDALNLGLHEMAHAIHIEYFDDDFEKRFPQWEKAAEHEVIKMRGQQDKILRNYAGQNKHELFAVCIETFFEQPGEMNSKAPGLFQAMCSLLNQNPMSMTASRVNH